MISLSDFVGVSMSCCRQNSAWRRLWIGKMWLLFLY